MTGLIIESVLHLGGVVTGMTGRSLPKDPASISVGSIGVALSRRRRVGENKHSVSNTGG